jgi:hypothetical protein
MNKRGLHELDYLTQSQAADYNVSLSQFKKCAPNYGIMPFVFMGRRLYRKSDLASVMERARSNLSRGVRNVISD